MTSLPEYRPIPPSKAERRRTALRQTLSLPQTLLRIHTIIRQDYEPAALDENLWAFWGFHQESWDRHYRARTWRKVSFGAIGPGDVVGMPARELALMMHVAMEIEDPIHDYSDQNGEGFRMLLPTLGRFTGRNEEQARYAADHGLAWCESPWCAEERRHANTFARIIERLAGMAPARDNPNDPMAVTSNEEDAVRLIIGRQSSEWNASSVYVVMAAHATGDLHTLIRNMARDEIKHLTILSAAASYLFGPQPWGRFIGLVKQGIEQYRRHQQRRSAGDYIGTNAVSALEVIAAHLLAEYRLRRWLASVPLRTLTAVFETPSNLPELAAFAPSPEREAQLAETLRKGKERRAGLVRWAPRQRRRALAQRSFEDASAGVIQQKVTAELDGFKSAERPGSAGDKQTRRWIRRVSSGRLRTSLLDQLRHYQIQHNGHVLARQPLPLEGPRESGAVR
jgi:hypothetical protein